MTEENVKLRVEVKLLNLHIARMRSALVKRELPVQHAKRRSMRPCEVKKDIRASKESQTASVDVIGEERLRELVQQKEEEKSLVVSLEQEIQDMLRGMNVRDIQLKEQNELITLLVQKLFCVYKNLRRVDDETTAMKLEEDRKTFIQQINSLQEDNEVLKEAVSKAKKSLSNLEKKAEEYLEERDEMKRKHRESLELIETLQRENVQELESYEKKHRDSMDKLEFLRHELEKYKEEHSSSLTKVRTLSDENRNQASVITTLQEKLRKSMERPPTTSTGVHAHVTIKDSGVDPHTPSTKHVGISHSPETKNIAIFSDIESQLIPAIMFEQEARPPLQLRTIACGTEFKHVTYEATVCEATDTDDLKSICTVTKPSHSYSTQKGTVEILELLEPNTLEAYPCGPALRPEALDFVPNRLVATARGKQICDLVELEVLEHEADVNIEPPCVDGTYERLEVIKVPKPCRNRSPLRSHKAQVLFNARNMNQSSNDSVTSRTFENVYHAVEIEEKPAKSVRIQQHQEPRRPQSPPKTSLIRSSETTDSEDKISATYYTVKNDKKNAPSEKDGIIELHAKKPAIRNREDSSRPSSSQRVNAESAQAAEDLQNVVHDLNVSVSRIIEKSPNEKACREKIAKLEAQLHAAFKQKELEIEVERQKRNREVENLKLTIRELEKLLQNKEENSVNLQNAVDLYLNSIDVLEQSEERYKNEVTQQRTTITNLQEALVATKQQLDELREKCQRDLEEKLILLDILDVSLCDLEKQCYHYYNQCVDSTATINYLRDQLLDVEVEKFDLLQDVLVLEARLLKYQQVSKQYECICGLKKEIKKLHVEVDLFKGEVENLQNYIKRCHQEIDSTKTILGKYLGQECSEYCIKQNESVVTLAQDTICYTEDLQCQMAVLETALKREQKINVVQATRIEELQNIIGTKNIEINRINDAYQDEKAKLDAAIAKSRGLEDTIRELQEHLNEMEMDNLHHDEKSDICHGELDICLNSLQSVKLKLRAQCKAMCQKMREYAQLQADCKIHANNAEMFKRDLENTRIRCRDEIIELKHNLRDLKEKLTHAEDKIDALNREVKHSQNLLVEASHHEAKIKQDFHVREKQLTQKIHSTQGEEMRLLDVVTQLEQQIVDMKNELDSKGVQLESAKQTILRMNSDALMKQQHTQEEINKLKNEINTLLQQQGAQKADNERLLQQIECMKCCIRQNEGDNQAIKARLEKCMEDLKNAEQEKSFLEQRNMTLVATLDKMQATIQARSESLAHMEVELIEVKTSRDEICNESRNVVYNVRAWLEEQKKINEELKTKLQKKNALIARYENEKRKNRCDCTSCPGYGRQRGGEQPPNYFENNVPPLSRSPWSLDSRGSGSESPTSSVSSTAADWYEYEVGYGAIIEEPTAELWVHRVESMTEELQRSNRYWKRKINDSEFMVTKDK
ncbi:hypothetical protein Trydic_g7840 [Trypoxylus dichotomus]